MIKFEGTTLVITGDLSSEDVKAIQQFADHQRLLEREAILKRLSEALELYEKIPLTEYWWSMNEIYDIIDKTFKYKDAVKDE